MLPLLLLFRFPLLTLLAAPLWSQDDVQSANRYDAPWLKQWASHGCSLLATANKTAGFVLQVGDSITHANPYGQWPRRGAGKTTTDEAILAWMHAGEESSVGGCDFASRNGWYLAAADTSSNRGLSASSGLQTGEFLSGDGNGGPVMPSVEVPAIAAGYLADGARIPNNLNVHTLAAAFSRAQVAVLMIGTNDSRHGVGVGAYIANLASIIAVFESQHILTVLSTIPPSADPDIDALVERYCQAIAVLAQERALPLIDFRAEILARRPGTSWNGTLLELNGPHPSTVGPGCTSSSDPYADGGSASLQRTGAACLQCGYLLRSWLTVQKMKQVKAEVIDALSVSPPHLVTSGPAIGTSPTGGTPELRPAR